MRTDLLQVCTSCWLRIPATRKTCPRCEGTALCAAVDADRRWRKAFKKSKSMNILLLAVAVACLAVACWLGVRFAWAKMVGTDPDAGLPFRTFAAVLGFLFGLLAGIIPTGLVIGALLWGHDSLVGREPVRLGVEAGGVPGVERWLRGRVARASGQVIEAPISGEPCVAFRLVGAAGGNAIDDGGAAAFELETGDGEIVLVEPEPAFVDLPVGALVGTGRIDGRLAALLAPRGIRAGVAFQVAEAIVRVGDAVEVGGAVTEHVEPGEGYRDHKVVRSLRASPDSPLVIRMGGREPPRA